MTLVGTIPRLPDVELSRCIGCGAYGQVWLGRNKVTSQLVAAKLIPLVGSALTPAAMREVAALVRLEASARKHHDHLVDIYHVGQTDEWLYYLMEPADDLSGVPAFDGDDYQPLTLSSLLKLRSLSLEQCFDLGEQLLRGLDALHQAGLAHRDVKPANCVIVEHKLKLADFGLVSPTDTTASIVGTPPYMPPDGRMDAQSDVYAAGLVLYEMFTQFPADCFPRLPNAPSSAISDPRAPAMNRLILRSCERIREQRYHDAGDMLTELQSIRQNGPRAPTRRRRTLIQVIAAAIAALVLATFAWRPAVSPDRVDVTFITEPYEAEILLDGKLAVDGQGRPWRTPCTIPQLEARVYHIQFRLDGHPALDGGRRDFSTERDVLAQWPSPASTSPSAR